MIDKDVIKSLLLGSGATAVMSLVCLFIEPVCAVICLVLGIAVTAVYVSRTAARYKKLDELNSYLALVCSGKFDLDIADNAEGELSILKNNLYKVITLLRSNNDALNRDKLYLADSLADISHQLKTPLTSMMIMADLLRQEKDESKRQEFISIIETQLEKMRWLILNLLNLSKLDAGTAEFRRESVSAAQVVEKSLAPLMVMMDLKGITLENDVRDFTFTGDENWTVEAVVNIIKNCIEHMYQDGALKISSICTSVYDAIIITDNGCGISREDLPHIFERFYHGSNSSSDSVGIGLALAKTVVEREKGKIVVTSKECVGSTFEIRFYKSIV